MRRDWLTLAFGLVLVAIVVALSLRQNMSRQPSDVPAARDPAPPAAPANPAIRTEPEAPGRDAATRPAAAAKPAAASRTEPPPSAPPVATLASLHVTSDVPGASVFLDRQFVGTTPLTLTSLQPGRKQLNVTATGHEGHAEGVDLAAGANRVNVEFTKVRLDTSIPVVHRHGMGSCQGTLAASVNGISYQTANKDDAFAIAFADLDAFEVDYLKKNLRVRRRGGRTWNFTNASADPLFVFHRDVSKARDRLAGAR